MKISLLFIKLISALILTQDSFQKKMTIRKSIESLKRKGFVYLTKHHYYARGRFNFNIKLTKAQAGNETMNIFINIFKKKIYDKLDQEMSCGDKEFRAFRAIGVKLYGNGSETFE